MIRILLLRVLYSGPLFAETPLCGPFKRKGLMLLVSRFWVRRLRRESGILGVDMMSPESMSEP